jgi:diguanylate cyclase (GGDEF)-like protein
VSLIDRTGFLHELRRALRDLRRLPFAVLLIEVTNRESIDHQFGFVLGDEVLVALGQRIEEAVGPGGRVGRFDAGQFVALVDEVRRFADVLAVADRVLASVSAPVQIGHQSVMSSIHIGIALPHPPEESADRLVRRVEEAVRVAKDTGTRLEVDLGSPHGDHPYEEPGGPPSVKAQGGFSPGSVPAPTLGADAGPPRRGGRRPT